MLHVVIIRKSGDKYAHGHIVADGFTKAFCGNGVPEFILETWDDPRNAYKGKGRITCRGCLDEYNSGRREGYRQETPSDVPVVETEETLPDAG